MMRATEELRNDHSVLRSQLTLLEQSLPLAPGARVGVADLIGALARCLHGHDEKEEALFALLNARLSQDAQRALPSLLKEHDTHGKILSGLAELLAADGEETIPQLAARARQFIDALREHLAMEEEAVFPAIDRSVGAQQAERMRELLRQIARGAFVAGEGRRRLAKPGAAIGEEMTIHQVLNAHPGARFIVEAFAIDCQEDGDRSLQELGWRRGVDVDALLLALNQSMGEPVETVPIPALLWNSCDGMMVIDADQRVLAINPALERLTGWKARDVAGRRECGVLMGCQDLEGCPMSERPDACPGLRAMRRARPVKAAEYTIRTADGRRLAVNTSYTPIQPTPNGPMWVLAVMRDASLQQRRERRLQHQAMTDPLTGLPNRASLFAAFTRALHHAERYGRPLAVVMADLDGLKGYNDTYGHPAGDRLLTAVARVLQAGCRGAEFIARYGGDEFVVLLPETDVAGALAIARRLCRAVAQFPFRRGEPLMACHAPRPITMTTGLAVFPADGLTAAALIDQADRRLYEAKQQRRRAGPERRRQPRIAAHLPVRIHRLTEGVQDAWSDAQTENLSARGLYVTVPRRDPVAIDELLTVSVGVPLEVQELLAVSRLAGRARVVRVDERASATAVGLTRFGIAVELI